MLLENLRADLEQAGNSQKAKIHQRFFKTGKGEYGEGDIFLGIVVPIQRMIAKRYIDLKLQDLQVLLNSKIHEYRLVALLILIDKYRQTTRLRTKDNEASARQEEIVNFYLKNTKNINNWDLVDLSCRDILGAYLFDKKRDVLYKLARSKNLWEKRIAMISTWWFIREKQFGDTIKIAEILLKDKHDLIHKAVGWMLREVGKKDQKVLEKFLDKYSKIMPRTALRYAIDKFEKKEREKWLYG